MASKKDIKSTLKGIIGKKDIPNRPPLNDDYSEDSPLKELSEKFPITQEMVDGLEKERKKNVGRPKLREKRKPQAKATFVIDIDQIYLLKYIALKERKLLKDVVAEAAADYIKKWEKANGKLNN